MDQNWHSVDLKKTKKTKKFSSKPKWLRVKLPTGKKFSNLRSIVDKHFCNNFSTTNCLTVLPVGEFMMNASEWSGYHLIH